MLSTLLAILFQNFRSAGFLKRGDVLLDVEGIDLIGLSATEAQDAITEAMGRLSVSQEVFDEIGFDLPCYVISYLAIKPYHVIPRDAILYSDIPSSANPNHSVPK